MMEVFTSAVASQFAAALLTLQQSIDRCDPDTWVAAHQDGAVTNVVFHTLYYADLYLEKGLEDFRTQPFHVERPDFFKDYEEEENRPPVHVYDQGGCDEYLEFCLEKSRRVILCETEESLAGETGFDWRPGTRAEHHIYNLRHIQHHAAQLGLRHQLLGGEALKWVGRG